MAAVEPLEQRRLGQSGRLVSCIGRLNGLPGGGLYITRVVRLDYISL